MAGRFWHREAAAEAEDIEVSAWLDEVIGRLSVPIIDLTAPDEPTAVDVTS